MGKVSERLLSMHCRLKMHYAVNVKIWIKKSDIRQLSSSNTYIAITKTYVHFFCKKPPTEQTNKEKMLETAGNCNFSNFFPCLMGFQD